MVEIFSLREKSHWKDHLWRSLSAAILTVFFVFALIISPMVFPAYATSGVVVQQSNSGCKPCLSTTISVSFPGSVTSGDIVVVGVASDGQQFSSLSDSLGSSYTQAAGASNSGSEYGYIFLATLSNAGPDTITVTFVGTPSMADVYVFEVSGVSTVSSATATGAGTGSSVSTSSPVSFQPGAFLLAVINSGTSVVQGKGFNLVSSTFTNESATEYATGGVPSPTNFPATLFVAAPWTEVGIALEPDSTSVTSATGPISTTTITSTVTTISTQTSTQTYTVVSTSTVTVASGVPPSTTTETVTTTLTPVQSVKTVTVNGNQTFTHSVPTILVYAYGAGGTPIAGNQISLKSSTGYSAIATTNSSGEAVFRGLSQTDNYNVSATINGVDLSVPVTLSQSGSAIVVLEPSHQTSANSTTDSSSAPSLSTSTSGVSTLPQSTIAIIALAVTVVGAVSLFLMIRRVR